MEVNATFGKLTSGAWNYTFNVSLERKHPLRICASGDVCAPSALTRYRAVAWHGDWWWMRITWNGRLLDAGAAVFLWIEVGLWLSRIRRAFLARSPGGSEAYAD